MHLFESLASDEFWKHYKALPKEVQLLGDKAYRLFAQNHDHTSLQFKKVGKKQTIYSARVTDFYRALCYIDGDKAYWFWIGNHNSYDRLIRNV